MWANVSGMIQRYEAFLRIDETCRASERVRARMIYAAGWAFLLLQVMNLISMTLIYGGWTRQHVVSVAVMTVFFVATHMLRFTKSPTGYALFYTAVPIAAIGVSSTMISPLLPDFGIATPLLPLLCGAVALVAFIGTRITTIIYVLSATALMAYLFTISTGLAQTPSDQAVAVKRAVQGIITILLVGPLCGFVSELVSKNLDEMESALARARDAEEARSGLMATLTHEIRTPLNGIVAMSDLLSRNNSLDAPAKASLDLVQLSSNALMDIVNRTLDRAKAEASQPMIVAEPFDLSELIDSTCELFKASARERGLWIGPSGTDTLEQLGLSHVVGDAQGLRQVLSNLIGNALKFTTTGGVRVGVKPTGTSDLQMDAFLRDEVTLTIFVQDTGVGIAPDEQDAVFEPFTQSASGASALDKGTGLGLPISRDMVAAMGGTLDLKSVPGKGTVFFFTLRLPLADGDTTKMRAA